MRVGLITTSFPRVADDPAGSFVAEHARWLVRHGHDVEVICAADAGQPHQPWLPGARIAPVPAAPGLFYAGGAPDALEQAESMAARARLAAAAVDFAARMAVDVARRAHAWDRIIAHWLLPCAALAAIAPRRAPLLAIAHSGDVHLAHRLGLTAPLGAVLAARDARLAFVSQDLRRRFLAAVPARARARLARTSLITPMGIDLARFAALRDRRAPAAPPTALFLGRLVPIKGAAVLLDAVRELERHGPTGLRVVIAGHGPARAELERRARALATPVSFAGEVRGAARDRLLAGADMLVVPSLPTPTGRTEGWPVTALEAMAAGVPVVASRTGGLAELPPGTASLVPPGRPRALAAAMTRLRDDRTHRSAQIRAAQAAVAHLDWSHVGARLFAAMA